MDLDLSITSGMASTKVCVKWDNFNFEIVGFPFIDGGVSRSPSCGVCASQLTRFVRMGSHVDDFNNANTFLTSKLLKQGCRCRRLRKAFFGFITDTPGWLLGAAFAWGLFCDRTCLSLCLVTIWFVFCHFPKCVLVHIRIKGEVGAVKLV